MWGCMRLLTYFLAIDTAFSQLHAPLRRLGDSQTDQKGPSSREFKGRDETAIVNLQAAPPSKYNGENIGIDYAIAVADSSVVHHEPRELGIWRFVIHVVIIAIECFLLDGCRRVRGLLDSPEENKRALQGETSIKVSMIFTVTDAEGRTLTEKEVIVEFSSEGLAKADFVLTESELDESETGLCEGCILELEPIECSENCDGYEELLAGGIVYTYDRSETTKESG